MNEQDLEKKASSFMQLVHDHGKLAAIIIAAIAGIAIGLWLRH
jgi:hypothetical protein